MDEGADGVEVGVVKRDRAGPGQSCGRAEAVAQGHGRQKDSKRYAWPVRRGAVVVAPQVVVEMGSHLEGIEDGESHGRGP
jgi:hypothetical protein